MARTVLLHHPYLDRTITRRSAQARVLALSGWQRVGGTLPPAPPPEPPADTPAPDDETTTDETADGDTTEE